MIKFESMLKSDNDGSLSSFRDNVHAILLNKFVAKHNNMNMQMDCPIHGNKDAIVGVLFLGDTPEFTVLECCCDYHKKEIYQLLEKK